MNFFRNFFVVLAAAATISSISVLAQERTAVRQGFSLLKGASDREKSI